MDVRWLSDDHDCDQVDDEKVVAPLLPPDTMPYPFSFVSLGWGDKKGREGVEIGGLQVGDKEERVVAGEGERMIVDGLHSCAPKPPNTFSPSPPLGVKCMDDYPYMNP